VKVVFEVENSALDLHWILNFITTLQKSATGNSSVTLALLSGQSNIVRIRSPFSPLLHLILLQRLHHMLMSSLHFLCAVICVQATITEWALTWNSMFFSK